MSIEKKFYQKEHDTNKIKYSFNFTDTKNKYFIKGKRYSIIDEVLNKKIKYNTLIEIGAGQTSTVMYLNEIYNFNKIIAFDIVDFDKKRIKNIELKTFNFNNSIPLKNNSVDCLIACMIIEHLFDPFHSFSEIERVLSRDGFGFINLPLITSFKNRFRLLFGQMPETSVPYSRWFNKKSWDGNHLHYFTIKSIYDICNYFNLKIIKIMPVGNFMFLKKLLPGLMCNEISFCVQKKYI